MTRKCHSNTCYIQLKFLKICYQKINCVNNNMMVEFHPNFFCVKELLKRKVLFQGKLNHGLYKINREIQHNKFSNSISNMKSTNVTPVFALNTVTFEKLHSRQGHPSEVVVNKIKKDTNMNVIGSHSKCVVRP